MVVKGEIRYSQEMGKHDEDVDENNILRFSVNRPSSRFHVGWWAEFDIANEHIAQLCLLGTISTAKWRIWTYSEIIRDRNTTAQKISCSETLKHFDIQRKTRLGVCLINSVTVARNILPHSLSNWNSNSLVNSLTNSLPNSITKLITKSRTKSRAKSRTHSCINLHHEKRFLSKDYREARLRNARIQLATSGLWDRRSNQLS